MDGGAVPLSVRVVVLYRRRHRREAQGAAAHPHVHGCAEEALPAAGQDTVRRFRAHVHRILRPGFLLQPWYA